jgi:hypothetical protein
MSTQKKAAPPPEVEADEEETISPALLDSVDWTPEQIANLEDQLDGKGKPIGPNVACNGYFKKSPGAQLIGRVVEATARESDLTPGKEDAILFIQGIADYPEDVKTKSGKAIVIRKGRYQGTFGYQVDAGGAAIVNAGRGTRVHLKVKELVDLSGGRTRWTYDFLRTA